MSEKKPRANDTEVSARVQEIMQCRLNGASFHDLQLLAAAKEWGVSERQLWRYVQRADRQMERHFEEDKPTLFRRHVLQRRRLFALALQDGDHRTALAILKDEGELLGLYQASQPGNDSNLLPDLRGFFIALGKALDPHPLAKAAVGDVLKQIARQTTTEEQTDAAP